MHHKVPDDGSGFTRYGNPYMIRGANYWHGMWLGADDCNGGDRKRMENEVRQLADMGINNLRIMASSEGPDDQPYRVRPSFMPKPGEYNEAVFKGLDYLLDTMEKYNMTAVMTMNNFWHWSGGFGQYVAWITGNQTIPYPVGDTTYDDFTQYAARFYNDSSVAPKAQEIFKNHIKTVQNRLANEPQQGPEWWFEEISSFMKKNAPKHLVSAGLESILDKYDFDRAHKHKDIDYTTCHLWVENRGIYDPANVTTFADAQAAAKDFISSRSKWAKTLSKPILLEEFGMARDAWHKPNDLEYKYDPSTPTTHKDKFYHDIFKQIVALAKDGEFSGSGFWAYSGQGRSSDYPNKYGMVFLGDPPHEPRGWYSVYDKDTTVKVIRDYNAELKNLEH
ncbi:glycoside hydrolase [Lichtheimia hyalospora FSU 10163]|nr:glycoside hydrolase [Lichtheimia hyalospora FSU 10163]